MNCLSKILDLLSGVMLLVLPKVTDIIIYHKNHQTSVPLEQLRLHLNEASELRTGDASAEQSLVGKVNTMSAVNCITNSSGTSSGIAYHFEASTNYRHSTTLPQWMKGMVHYYTILYYIIYSNIPRMMMTKK